MPGYLYVALVVVAVRVYMAQYAGEGEARRSGTDSGGDAQQRHGCDARAFQGEGGKRAGDCIASVAAA